ncbi:hypothetical protein GCM10009785_33380 [Brooklawnia cerclae]|uniref:PRC-barrel domain-containing protein n=1 Tax=Brooklawnia cerclae TaxID=349934 RepID=A0ABX0SG93_9ACTN|nr:PRC-barrel domain-containing protein [Brooklawnia cerclae]NIH55746.1 hypothetical protein [Brooklawnia cerclae]
MSAAHDDLYSSTVVDAGGARVGPVGQVYLDDATGQPVYVTARMGLFGTREVFVPLAGAMLGEGLVRVPFPAEIIKQAPQVPSDRHLDPAEEAGVYRHYGLEFSVRSGAPGPDQAAPSPDGVTTGDDAPQG